MKVEPDGSFRIDDVIAGSYELSFKLRSRRPVLPGTGGEIIGGGPPGGDSRRDARWPERLRRWTSARSRLCRRLRERSSRWRSLAGVPGGVARRQAARPRRLSRQVRAARLLGHLVRPLPGRDPRSQGTFDAFGEDERFAMIGLSLDQSKDAPITCRRTIFAGRKASSATGARKDPRRIRRQRHPRDLADRSGRQGHCQGPERQGDPQDRRQGTRQGMSWP